MAMVGIDSGSLWRRTHSLSHSNIYTIIRHVQETSEILPLSTVFFQPVELVTTCTLTMLDALEVVRAAYCAL